MVLKSGGGGETIVSLRKAVVGVVVVGLDIN